MSPGSDSDDIQGPDEVFAGDERTEELWREKEVDRADAIILVYSLEAEESQTKVSEYWIPWLESIPGKSRRKHSRQVPIIIAAHKLSLSMAASERYSDACTLFKDCERSLEFTV